MPDAEFISVCKPVDTFQAGQIREALEQQDIICYINNENTASVHFGGSGTGAATMSVMVPEDQVEAARWVIESLGF